MADCWSKGAHIWRLRTPDPRGKLVSPWQEALSDLTHPRVCTGRRQTKNHLKNVAQPHSVGHIGSASSEYTESLWGEKRRAPAGICGGGCPPRFCKLPGARGNAISNVGPSTANQHMSLKRSATLNG